MTLTPEQTKRLAMVTTLHNGAGKNGLADACVMQAVDWVYRNGDHFTDAPDCTPPTLRRFAIRLNDACWPSDDARTEALRPLIPYLVGADPSPEAEQKRMYLFADFAVREAAPFELDAWYERTKNDWYRERAVALRACAPIVDRETAEAGRVVARSADAAHAAHAAADAAHAAARAADGAAACAADGLPILRRAAEVLMAACQVTK